MAATLLLGVAANVHSDAPMVQVATADELSSAIQDGAVHIEVTQHLDLRNQAAANESDPYSAHFEMGVELQSITARSCAAHVLVLLRIEAAHVAVLDQCGKVNSMLPHVWRQLCIFPVIALRKYCFFRFATFKSKHSPV